MRRVVRQEMRSAIGQAGAALWAECARLRWPARLRLALRLLRGLAFDGKRIKKGGEA
jgi:hypothetical protein